MNFNLKNIKTAKSRNGFSMTAKFFINDIHAADFKDYGDGSEPSFYIHDKELFAEFQEKLNELPEIYIEHFDMNMKIDAALFIDLLHEAIVNKQQFKLLAA